MVASNEFKYFLISIVFVFDVHEFCRAARFDHIFGFGCEFLGNEESSTYANQHTVIVLLSSMKFRSKEDEQRAALIFQHMSCSETQQHCLVVPTALQRHENVPRLQEVRE